MGTGFYRKVSHALSTICIAPFEALKIQHWYAYLISFSVYLSWHVCVRVFEWQRNRNNNDLPSPPGFNPSVGQSNMEVTMDTDQSHLILKKSWDIALGPIKQVSALSTNCAQPNWTGNVNRMEWILAATEHFFYLRFYRHFDSYSICFHCFFFILLLLPLQFRYRWTF